jgi:glycosyltransferase involved in cell wall biosynthesis
VGRLAAEKNLELVVQSYQQIRQSVPNSKLVFVGDGPYRSTLQERCPDAVFAGFQTGHDLASHYASADLFLFPSLTETFGNVTLEAMSSGLPVVAYEHAAAKELITPSRHGALAQAGNADHFLAQAMLLASNPALREDMRLHVRNRAMEMGWSAIMDKLESVYGSLTNLSSAMATVDSNPSICSV